MVCTFTVMSVYKDVAYNGKVQKIRVSNKIKFRTLQNFLVNFY